MHRKVSFFATSRIQKKKRHVKQRPKPLLGRIDSRLRLIGLIGQPLSWRFGRFDEMVPDCLPYIRYFLVPLCLAMSCYSGLKNWGGENIRIRQPNFEHIREDQCICNLHSFLCGQPQAAILVSLNFRRRAIWEAKICWRSHPATFVSTAVNRHKLLISNWEGGGVLSQAN